MNWDKKPTATHAGDVKHKEVTQFDSREVDSDVIVIIDPKPPDPKHKESLTVMKSTCTNPEVTEEPSQRKSARFEESKPRRATDPKAICTKWEPSRFTKAMLSAKLGLTLLPSLLWSKY